MLFSSHTTILLLVISLRKVVGTTELVKIVLKSFNYPQDCVGLHVTVNGTVVLPEMQEIFMDFRHDNPRKLAAMLRKEARCLLSVHTGDSLELLNKLLLVSAPVNDQITVHTGSVEPSMHIQRDLKRPLLWIREFDIVEIFCPKVGRPKTPSRTSFVLKHGNLLELCPNPFDGQNVTLDGSRTFPSFLFPGMFNTEKVSGFKHNLFVTMCEHFRCNIKFSFSSTGAYIPQNRSFTPGNFDSLMRDKVEFASGTHLPMFHSLFDVSSPYHFANLVYMTRLPKPIASYGHNSKPFPPNVWTILLLTCGAIATLMLLAHRVYRLSPIDKQTLTRKEENWTNFYLYVFAKITEPEPLPWFPKWSTGKFLTLLWSLLSLSLLSFYSSNLRAHLVTVEYEEAPTTLEHIVRRGETVFMFSRALTQRRDFLEDTGQAGTTRHKIAILSEQTGGFYSFEDTRGKLPTNAPKDLHDSGAFILTEAITIPYFSAVYPTMLREQLYIVDEPTYSYYKVFLLRKHSPGTVHFDKFLMRITDSGMFGKWMFDHLPMRSVLKPKSPQSELRALQLYSFSSSFIFLCCGTLLASVGFVAEYLKGRKIQRTQSAHPGIKRLAPSRIAVME